MRFLLLSLLGLALLYGTPLVPATAIELPETLPVTEHGKKHPHPHHRPSPSPVRKCPKMCTGRLRAEVVCLKLPGLCKLVPCVLKPVHREISTVDRKKKRKKKKKPKKPKKPKKKKKPKNKWACIPIDASTTPSATPTASISVSPSAVPSPSPSPTVTPTASNSPKPSVSPTSSTSPSPSPSSCYASYEVVHHKSEKVVERSSSHKPKGDPKKIIVKCICPDGMKAKELLVDPYLSPYAIKLCLIHRLGYMCNSGGHPPFADFCHDVRFAQKKCCKSKGGKLLGGSKMISGLEGVSVRDGGPKKPPICNVKRY